MTGKPHPHPLRAFDLQGTTLAGVLNEIHAQFEEGLPSMKACIPSLVVEVRSCALLLCSDPALPGRCRLNCLLHRREGALSSVF